MLSSKTRRELKIDQRQILIDSIEIGIPSTDRILAWGERILPNGKRVGLVKNSKTVNYKRFTPFRDGLFCERIFGPVTSFVCACGKKQPHSKITFCEKCEVEYIDQRSRRYRLGYISLLSPVTHIWYLKGRPSYLSLFLGKRKKSVVALAYCNAYLIEHGISKRGTIVKKGHTSPSQTLLSSTRNFLQDVEANQIQLCKSFCHGHSFTGARQAQDWQNRHGGVTSLRNKIEKEKLNEETRLKILPSGCLRSQKDTKPVRNECHPLLYRHPSSRSIVSPGSTFDKTEVELKDLTTKNKRRCNTNLLERSLYQDGKEKDFLTEMSHCSTGLASTNSVEQCEERHLLRPFCKSNLQGTTYLYVRQHTLPFLPSLISHFYLRDALLNFTYSLPAHDDLPLMEYCHIKRWEPLRDVHKFMAHRAVKDDLSNPLQSLEKGFCKKTARLKKARGYKAPCFYSSKLVQSNCQSCACRANPRTSSLALRGKAIANPRLANPRLCKCQSLFCRAKPALRNKSKSVLQWCTRKKVLARTTDQLFCASEGAAKLTSSPPTCFFLVKGYARLFCKAKQNKAKQSKAKHRMCFANRRFAQNVQIFDLKSKAQKICKAKQTKAKGLRAQRTATRQGPCAQAHGHRRANGYVQGACNPFACLTNRIEIRSDTPTQLVGTQLFCFQELLPQRRALNPSFPFYPKREKAALFRKEGSLIAKSKKRNALRKQPGCKPPIWAPINSAELGASLSGLELSAIREILSYTGGGALQRLLQQFDQHDLSKLLFAEAQILRVLYETHLAHFSNALVPPSFNESFLPLLCKGTERNQFLSTGGVETKWNLFCKSSVLCKHAARGSIVKKRVEQERKNELPNRANDLRRKQIVRISRRIYKTTRRLKVTQLLTRNHRKPEWMILSHLPVLPPDLRPILQMSEKVIVASDLNVMYQRVIYRNNRHLRVRFIDFHLVTAIQRLVQDAVDRLIENGKGGSKPYYTQSGRPLKSLSEILKGKKGRFRLNLLGKRVDFSGRSVIVVSPSCKIHECGLPKEIALELYHYFLLRQLIVKRYCASIVTAKKMIKSKSPLMWDILRELMYHHPILLNRAPTLHRLGIQAFQPKLVLGNAILLHPLVCSGFNADFDGDQMGVHLPLSFEARAESWDLLWSRNNLLSPATGQPMLVPSQDMVLGFYYITAQSLQSFNRTTRKSDTVSSFKKEGRHVYKRQTSFFLSTQEITTAFQSGKITLHQPVWLHWSSKIEGEDCSQIPVELRVHSFGVQQFVYEKHIYSHFCTRAGSSCTKMRSDPVSPPPENKGKGICKQPYNYSSNMSAYNPSSSILTNPQAYYFRTTAGRILMNNLLDT